MALALSCLLVVAACSDDDSKATAAATSTTTTAPGSGRPLNESDLVSALAKPGDIAEGLRRNDRLATGEFRADVCEGHEVEATWEDQASQYLVRFSDGNALVVMHAVLAFSDDEEADTFFDAAVDAVAGCDPEAGTEEVADVADRASRVTLPAGGAVQMLLRSGSHVVSLRASGAGDVPDTVVTTELAARLLAPLPA